MANWIFSIQRLLSAELLFFQEKPRKLARVRGRQIWAWLCYQFYIQTRPRRLLKAGRDATLEVIKTGAIGLLLLAIVKADVFPWLTELARRLTPANQSDLEKLQEKEEASLAAANIVIDRIRKNFSLRSELTADAMDAIGLKIRSGLQNVTDQQVRQINFGEAVIPLHFSANFKKPPTAVVTYKNIDYENVRTATSTLKTAQATCDYSQCAVTINWTEPNPNKRQNRVKFGLQIFWVVVGEFPDNERAGNTPGTEDQSDQPQQPPN